MTKLSIREATFMNFLFLFFLFSFIFSGKAFATCGVNCDSCTPGSTRCSNGVEWKCNYQGNYCCIGCAPGPCIMIGGPGCCYGGCLNGDSCWAISGSCCIPSSCGLLDDSRSGFECNESFGTWTFAEYAGTSSGTADRSKDQAKSGSYSLKVDYRGISTYYTAYTRVGSGPSVNEQARFSGYYKVTTKEGNPGLKICIQHREAGTYLGEDCFPLSSARGDWTHFDVVSPNKGLLEDQTSLQFVSSGDTGDDHLVYYVDDLCLTYESSCNVPDCPR